MKNQSTFQRIKIGVDPEYLVEISNSIDMLNHFYEQEGIGSLSSDYRNVLITSFSALNQKLQIYNSNQAYDASCMLQGSIIKCRADLEIFCLTKIGDLLANESEDLGRIINRVAINYRNNVDEFERVLQTERRKRAEAVENDKDKIINKFKQELIHRKEYIQEIKARLEEVEAENSKLYQRIINKAKHSSQRGLSPSPQKHISAANQSMVKIKTDIIQRTTHKPQTSKQIEETVHDIMQTKQRQENVKGKKVSLDMYLKTYFRNKFGVRNMAEEMEIIFRESIEELANFQQKSVFILFGKMIAEECEEQYFWQQKGHQEKVTKIIKRYMNEKYGWAIEDLDKFYDGKVTSDRNDFLLSGKDVQYVLINLYKTTQIQELQEIFIQNLLPKLEEEQMEGGSEEFFMPSLRLINEILNYELNRHLSRIDEVLRIMNQFDFGGQSRIFDFQSLLIRLNIPNQKIIGSQNVINGYKNRPLIRSQVIQGVEKIRKAKPKRR